MLKKKILQVLMYLLPVLFLSLILLLYQSSLNKTLPIYTSEELQGIPTPTPESFVPSPWAQDNEVLSLEANVLTLEKDLSSVDLKETQLQPPVLEMNVKY